jgi:hypothetical protein
MSSLLEAAMTACRIMDIVSVEDGEGGFIEEYTPGAQFQAAITLDSSTQARIAEHDGVKNLYTVTTSRKVNLQPNKVIRREKDQKTFRITNDGSDNETPSIAKLDMRQVAAEEWEIPT